MEATQLRHLMAQELPRLSITEIDDNFLIRDLKVKPCRFGADRKQGPAKCPFLHPGEKGRRDLGRFHYSSTSCPRYSLNTRSCPEGDHCPFAHGFLERRFHPLRYSSKTLVFLELKSYLEREDILDESKKLGWLHSHPADAEERAAIKHILDLNGTDLISGYEPNAARRVHGCAPVSLNDLIFNPLTRVRIATDLIRKLYLCNESVTRATLDYENAFILEENVHLEPELFLKHNKGIGVTHLEERVGLICAQSQLLSAVDAPLMARGSSVPKDPNSGRIRRPNKYLDSGARRPNKYLDSGASVHVVGDRRMLQRYQVLAEPWQIAVGDGHPLVVVGIGIISQHGFIIPNVFHVQGLQMNLISVSQLDRDHGLFSGFHDGICKILKRGGDVVGGGFLLANGLYALSFLQVPETEILQVPETETGGEARLGHPSNVIEHPS